MEVITSVFNEIFYRPLFNVLVFLYTVLPGNDLGVAIIVLTLLSRVVLFPVNQKAIRSQRALGELQPKIKKIQETHGQDKGKQTKAIMELYKTHGVNPFSGCLPLLVQLPILIALYRVFFFGIDSSHLNILYSFVRAPETINTSFLFFTDLSQKGNESVVGIVFIVFAGITQFIQAKTMSSPHQVSAKDGSSRADDFSKIMQTQTVYLFPLFVMMLLWNFQSALALYFITTNVFSIFQQYFVAKQFSIKENP